MDVVPLPGDISAHFASIIVPCPGHHALAPPIVRRGVLIPPSPDVLTLGVDATLYFDGVAWFGLVGGDFD